MFIARSINLIDMKNVSLSGGMPKRKLIVEVIAAILLVFFVHTLISSYIQLQSLKNLLAFYTKYTTEVAWMMILSELVISVLLFTPRIRHLGLIFVTLYSVFGFYIVITHFHYPHDFGGVLNRISTSQQLVLFCLLFVLALFGLISRLRKSRSKTDSEPSIVFT